MEISSILLSMLAVLLVNLLFAMEMLQYGVESRWMVLYLAVVLFYAALYFRRLRHLRPVFRRGLGYAAIALGAFLSSLFFCSFAAPAGMLWPVAIVVLLGLAVAAYFLYRVIVLPLDEAEDAAHAQRGLRPTV